MISNKEYIELFFSRSFEKDVDNLVLDDKNYIVPKDKICKYVDDLLAIPYAEFLSYVKEHPSIAPVESSEITQSSTFSNCELEMCKKLIFENNPGLKAIEVGMLFPDDVKHHNKTAFTKYGENQVKTAENLGLTYNYYDYWYLSCLGYIYPSLCDEKRVSLLARTILRNKLYSRIIIESLKNDVSIEKYMSCLSIPTIERRMASVAKLLSICVRECHIEGIQLHTILEYRKKTHNKDAYIYYVDINSDIIKNCALFYKTLNESKELLSPTIDNSYDDKFILIGRDELIKWEVINKQNSISYYIYKMVVELICKFTKSANFNLSDFIDIFDFIKPAQRKQIVTKIINRLVYYNEPIVGDNCLLFTKNEGEHLYVCYNSDVQSTINLEYKAIYDLIYQNDEVSYETATASEDVSTELYNHTILIKKKVIDFDFFEKGFQIQEKFLDKLEDAIGCKIVKGSKIPVEIRFNDILYNCIIECPDTRSQSKNVNLLWKDGRRARITLALQKHFNKTYQFLKNEKNAAKAAKKDYIPDNLKYSVYLTYIKDSHTLILDPNYSVKVAEDLNVENTDSINEIQYELTVPDELISILNAQLDIFTKMRRSSRGGVKAPHKPVLMIAIILLYEKYTICKEIVELNNGLKARFTDVWDVYVKRKELFSCSIYNPFNHIDESIGEILSYFSPPCIKLSKNLLILLQNKEAREIMKRHLISMIN